MKVALLAFVFMAIVATAVVDASVPRKKPQKFISKAITDLRKGASIARTQSSESLATCNKELKLLKLDDHVYTEEQKAADEDDRNGRAEDKASLSNAISKRLAGMQKMLQRLFDLSRKLTKHIENINKIFKTKFKSDDADMQGAQDVLNALKSHIEHGNAEMDPIVAGQTKPKAPVDTALVELKGQPQCNSASEAAYKMWNESHTYHEEMQAFFEGERIALGKVKEAIEAIIAKKRARMQQLMEQDNRLKQLLAGNGTNTTDVDRRPVGFLAELLHKQVEKHNKIVVDACRRIDVERPMMKEKRRALFAELKECKKQAGYLEDGVSKDEEFVRSKLATLAWDELGDKFDVDLDAKVTYAETVQTVGDIKAMPKEKFEEIADNNMKVSRFEYFKTLAQLLRNEDTTALPNITMAKNITNQASTRVFTLSEISV